MPLAKAMASMRMAQEDIYDPKPDQGACRIAAGPTARSIVAFDASHPAKPVNDGIVAKGVSCRFGKQRGIRNAVNCAAMYNASLSYKPALKKTRAASQALLDLPLLRLL